MANVTLEIAGRPYTVACQDGQEAHIAALGRAIDAKLDSVAPQALQNEMRTLLFAALLLADEAHELRQAAVRAQQALPEPVALEALAGRLENLAASLEGGARDD